MPALSLPEWLWVDPTPLYKTSQYITRDPVNPLRFVQIFQSIPFLEPFYTEFEKNFNVKEPYRIIRDNTWVPIIATILYLSFLIEGKKYVERRKLEGKGPVNLGLFPAFWNGFLALFSIVGALRVVPHFLFMFTHKDFKMTVCEIPDTAGYGDGAAGMWVMLFTVSKVFELVDTMILVLKGKDPMFLHWYHHVTVLLYTWFSYAARNPGIYFVAMNYCVHAVMYTYYFLMELKLWPKSLSPIFITLMQISQMLVGVAITAAAYNFQSDPSCGVVRDLIPWCAGMYATYLYFFVLFFVERFWPSLFASSSSSSSRQESNGGTVPAAGGLGRSTGTRAVKSRKEE